MNAHTRRALRVAARRKERSYDDKWAKRPPREPVSYKTIDDAVRSYYSAVYKKMNEDRKREVEAMLGAMVETDGDTTLRVAPPYGIDDPPQVRLEVYEGIPVARGRWHGQGPSPEPDRPS